MNTIPENIDGGQSIMTACFLGVPECETLQRQLRDWMWFVAGSYFTTFPVG